MTCLETSYYMLSRYDFYDESVSCDEDGICWPDPLAIDYNKGELQEVPIAHKVSAGDLAKFWLLMYNTYGLVELDDLVLEEGGIPYLMELKPGDTIYLPKKDDILGFINTAKSAEIT